jgi:hypothetical protein
MRFPKNTVLYTGITLIAALFLLLSCGGAQNPRLDGTWTLTTASGGGDEVGNGTYTISYSTEVPIDENITTYFYSGEALMTIGSEDTTYKVSVEQRFGSGGFDFALYLCDDLAKKYSDSIEMTGNLSGSSSASGNYEGIGTEYDHFGTGSFFTRKEN